ncbi:Mitochondrial fission protein [Bacidia gigantensis]|uniref:Mitochondrial fission protein n=1 Tax=Bacidia gigantensis TaxID=2732470 RepID=UPI001D04AAB8|nr:Mitochondrial fission protein [Bacidia gigantensis]KAG8527581.1 Mitochondrial fission protein [Bacidia gigantensis]
MAQADGSPRQTRNTSDEASMLGNALSTRHIEAFGRKVTTTASHLISDSRNSEHYQNAMSQLQRELRRPTFQTSIFAQARASPTELVRSKLSVNEMKHRALSYLPDDVLKDIPEDDNDYSLFQGFQATVPEIEESEHRKKHRRHGTRRRLLLEHSEDDATPIALTKRERHRVHRNLEMMEVRKNMCSTEIREVDAKISNLNNMRKVILGRLEDLEQEEVQMAQDLRDIDDKLEDLLEEAEEVATLAPTATPPTEAEVEPDLTEEETSFMSQSIYEKLPSPKSKRHKPARRKSTAIRHEHFDPGTSIREIQAHNDMITSLDFDAPFGTMVSSAFDDTVRVWDLNLGRCIGLLEGHQASVRCLQVEENFVATGSMDASIRLWDLDQAEYAPRENRASESKFHDEDNGTEEKVPAAAQVSSTADCHVHTLNAHVAEVTALHFKGDTLVSGSADKTLRQWDLATGRCVQTLDVLWAAAQASATIGNTTSSSPDPSGRGGPVSSWQNAGSRVPDSSADFVGALQCFDAALACGTADGMVRLWDLRSGQVHRSLVGHTGAISCLQFDERVLVTGSADRSIRIWDLRTGSIRDAYAYDNPVTGMMFDARRIIAAAGESVAKVYDKTDGRHWDCGESTAENEANASIVERVRVRDGYLVEGRKDGVVGIWSC